MEKTLILIPAYQPSDALVDLTQQLSEFTDVLIVNDGSTGASLKVLEQVQCENVTVIGYETNKGKGFALKYGIDWAHKHNYACVVTADSDGQHLTRDILNIAKALQSSPTALVLGVRNKKQMPLRSKFGNNLTCRLFHLLYNIKITDTQTGLRGFSLERDICRRLLSISGDRYEYETNVLLNSKQIFDDIIEIPIETVYLKNNESSHFHPLKDSIKIYKILFQRFPLFALASFLSFIADYLLFNIFCYCLLFNVIFSTVAARIFSAGFNFFLNKKFVFKNSSRYYSFFRYAVLAACILLLNCGLIWLLAEILHIPSWIAKLMVELVLYCASFTAQSNMTKKE